MKKASATTYLEVWVDCPHCQNYQEVTDELREELVSDLTANHLDTEINCDNKECKKVYMVTKVTY